MSLGRQNFDQISEADLVALAEAGVPEGIHYEYKSANYSKNDVREFLKDASSFANTAGGHLIIGMNAEEGLASKLAPIIGLDSDAEILRVENLMRDGLEPRVSGYRIKAVPVSSGGFILVIRIQRSWNPPHRVSVQNTNRFYIRNSAGVHEASVEELRVLFNFSGNNQERIAQFREQRIPKLANGEGIVGFSNADGVVALHIVPLSAFSQLNEVDLQTANALHRKIHPIAVTQSEGRFNFEGFITVRQGTTCYGYTQIFRNGSLEAVKSRIKTERLDQPVIQTKYFVADLIAALLRYVEALRSMEVSPPLIVMITLIGTYRVILDVGLHDWSFEDVSPITHDNLELPPVIIDDYGNPSSYLAALRPAFDTLWNAGGFERCTYFNESGDWIGP